MVNYYKCTIFVFYLAFITLAWHLICLIVLNIINGRWKLLVAWHLVQVLVCTAYSLLFMRCLIEYFVLILMNILLVQHIILLLGLFLFKPFTVPITFHQPCKTNFSFVKVFFNLSCTCLNE